MKIVLTEQQYNVVNQDSKILSDMISGFNHLLDSYISKIPFSAKMLMDSKRIVNDIRNEATNLYTRYFPSIKTGVNGNKFLIDLYGIVYKGIDKELTNINPIKKKSILVMSGGKNGLINGLNETDFDSFFDLPIGDFAVWNLIGNAQDTPYSDQFSNFDNGVYDAIVQLKSQMIDGLKKLIISKFSV